MVRKIGEPSLKGGTVESRKLRFTVDEREVLMDGRRRVAAPQWKPIETAPKDGTAVWLFCSEWEPAQCSGLWQPELHFWRRLPTEDIVSDYLSEHAPTHWMPLPEAPR